MPFYSCNVPAGSLTDNETDTVLADLTGWLDAHADHHR
jgi:hypothetical protein